MKRSANYRLRVALILLGMIAGLALCAPWLATHDPRRAMPEDQYQNPSTAHLLGTDQLGRDVFSRVLYGGRSTLSMAALAVAVTLGPGSVIGLAAGYAGRWIDRALMACMDALLAVPSLLLALALIAVLGSGMVQIALAVGVAEIPAYARVTRAAVLEARALPHIEAARSIGARAPGILWRHILPVILPTLLAFAGVMLSWAILNGAALMFLGYGGDITAPDWGVMLSDGRQVFRTAPWAAFAPGVALSLTVFGVNLLAGSLNGPPRRV